jgi:DNA-binding CsgD family transcriptional regulator
MDFVAGAGLGHVAIEGSILLMAASGVVRLLFLNWRLDHQTRRLAHDLASSNAQAEIWRQDAAEALSGLGVAIDQQFHRWGLTPAEAEVGLLLLRGLSLKEVAQVRSVSERTAREQARAVYRKAELDGRADLAAFFLEDLLLPQKPSRPAPGSPPARGVQT